MLKHEDLTADQQAVVEHGDGPAVVLAVPGAGKTTTLVHRIRRLVEVEGVPPHRILASTFSRATLEDVRRALASLGIHGVDTRTLHGLGHALLKQTGNEVRPAHDEDTSNLSPDTKAYRLARHALRDLADMQNLNTEDIGITPRELVDQIAAWKQQLAYPNPDAADLSSEARAVAQRADHENDDFLILYRRFEARRHGRGWITFPDMLRDGWELLIHNDGLRSKLQQAYRYVLVDEFQDVSRAQYHILDLLTEAHRNYMVVGDDDQSIYQWRGARPSFLLNFSSRYEADEYRMTESFRLHAAPLALANASIAHNENRSQKHIQLTRGFRGTVRLLTGATPAARATALGEQVRSILNENRRSLDEMIVLVRTYGQTPPIEQALHQQEIPYHVQGQAPFYRRREVQTLLRYLYWAVLEQKRRVAGWFDDAETAEQYTDRFARIANEPNRYIARGRIDRITQEAVDQRTSVLDRMASHLAEMHERTAERAEHFLEVAHALIDLLQDPAHETLRWLVDAIDYESALRERSALPERADARIQTVRSLVRFGQGHDSASALLQEIHALAEAHRQQGRRSQALHIRSIHRAKGAEWPVVFLADCVEGTLPLSTEREACTEVEEERRLFYVGVTRSTDELYITTTDADGRSPFLSEADAETHLQNCRQIRTTLETHPDSLSDEAVARFCAGIVDEGLEHYFRSWWTPSDSYSRALQSRLNALSSAIDTAEKRVSAHRDTRQQYKEEQEAARSRARRRTDELRSHLGEETFSVSHEERETMYPSDATFTFDWTGEGATIGVYWQDRRVGILDPFGSSRLDTPTLLELPWTEMVGQFEGVTKGRNRLHLTIDWEATEREVANAEVATVESPDPVSKCDRLLTSPTVKAGHALLQECLSSSVDNA